MAVAAVLAALLALAFASIASCLVFAPALVREADAAVVAALRSVPDGLGRAAGVAARVGDPRPALLASLAVAALLAWRRHGILLLGWVIAIAGNGVCTWALKRAFARVRPLDDAGLATSGTFSFPSAHSSGLMVACGMLAWLAVRLLPTRLAVPAVLACTGLVVAVGASRILLGHHHPSDVLAGFLSGGTWLAGCIVAIEWAGPHLVAAGERVRARRRARLAAA
jgi:undecaprenyl-diphosphatase